MFNMNGMSATLVKNNRNVSQYYDDQDKQTQKIKLCPFNTDQTVKFGMYTVPEATGYFILRNCIDVREGDQIIFNGRTYSILHVKDNWIWNKLVNYTVAVK